MRRSVLAALVLLTLMLPKVPGTFLLLAQEAPGETSAPPPARASLPLEDVLALYRERDAARRDQVEIPAPPLDAVVDRIDMRGRLLDDALEITAKVELTVLAEERWVRLPLLEVSPRTVLGEISSSLPGLALAVDAGRLVAIARRGPGAPRTFAFEISLLERARVDDGVRRVRLEPAEATLRHLSLELDEGLFKLEGSDARRRGENYRVFPGPRGFEVAWRRLRPESAQVTASRPPIEPAITAAHLSTVSTLEGDVHHRLRYDLRFEGQREIRIEMPPTVKLRKVFVNGRSVPFELDGGALTLQVEPARAGDRLGRVELSLEPPRAAYHLSGELFFTLPAVSWPIDHLFARLHLPSVFDYRWSGGSLAPAGEVPEGRFTEYLPTPGDELRFQQALVQRSQPTIRVAYDIDLEGQVFLGN